MTARTVLAFLSLIQAAVPVVAAEPGTAPVRVFVAPFKGAVSTDVLGVFEARVVAAARKDGRFDVVGASDLQGILDAEGMRRAAGCDAGSNDCAAELAGALDAPQLILGKVANVGETWVLSLSRVERGSLAVLGRVSVEARGTSPEPLLGLVEPAVAELLGAPPPPSPLLWVGAGLAAGGAAALAVSGVVGAYSWSYFNEAKEKLDQPGYARDDVLESGNRLNNVAVGALAAGVVLGAAGGVCLGLALLQELP